MERLFRLPALHTNIVIVILAIFAFSLWSHIREARKSRLRRARRCSGRVGGFVVATVGSGSCCFGGMRVAVQVQMLAWHPQFVALTVRNWPWSTLPTSPVTNRTFASLKSSLV